MSQSGVLNLLNDEKNKQITNVTLNLHTIFDKPLYICDSGSILKKDLCG